MVRRKRPRRRGDGRLGLFERLESRVPLAADIAAGLVHHWTFDETSGDIAADAAGGSDGSLFNWAENEPKWEPGRVDGALRFDTDDNFVLANPPPMNGSYSVSFWLNATERSAFQPRIFQSRAGNDIYISINNNRGVGFASNGTNTVGSEPPTFNTWEHYALNFNAATGQGIVYRGGAPVALGLFVDSTSLTDWVIGHSVNLGSPSETLRGALDDLRVYDRLLTDEDIAALSELGTAEPTHVDPIHHWKFDETNGFTAFDSAGDADAVLVNWNASEPRWVKGKVGGAVEFSTPDNFIATPPAGTHAQWSVAFWINLTGGFDNYPRIIGPKDDVDLWAYLGAENNQGVSFRSRGMQTIEPGFPPFGEWSHYAINFDTIADVGTIYRDGVPVASGYFGDNSPAQSWIIGHNSDFANHQDTLQGLLDDLRVYDRLLSKPEIEALVAMGEPTPPPQGLVHHWTFDETTGNVAADVAGSNDGELRNFGPTQTKWVAGKIGGAISFTTADDLIITEAPITKKQYTFSFWLKQTEEGGFNPRIFNPGEDDWILICQFGGNGVCFGGSVDPNVPTPNTWEHYAVTWNRLSGQTEVYRSGVKVASGTFVAPPPILPWVMGHSATVEHHIDSLHGMLDDMRVYDRVLSASEVQQLASLMPLAAVNDAYSTNEDVNLVVDASLGVKKNDSDLSADTEAVVDVLPSHGQLTLNDDGSFTYDPDADYNGPDSFVYRLSDPQGNFTVATVSLTVDAVNDVPTFLVGADRFVDDEAGSRGITHWASQVTAGPPDEADQTLTFEAIADKPELLAVQPKVEVVDGTLPGLWGRLTYALARNKTGVVTVTIRLKDNGGVENGGVDTTPTQTFKINIAKAHPGHNAIIAMDVDDDGAIAASDALSVINYINAFGSIPVPPEEGAMAPYHDVNADGTIAADDALTVINYLNSSQPGSATFVETDTTTQGDWQASYGTAGYVLNSGAASLPDYARLSAIGSYDVTWAATTTDSRALQKPASADRFAAAWTGHNPETPHLLNGFILDLNLTDDLTHRVAIYILDWDTSSRTQRMEVLVANTGRVLDTQLSGPFHDGKYLVWMLKGHVKIRFTNLANGLNAVASGIFFD